LEDKLKNKVWTLGIAKAGCVPKVFGFKELIAWCALRFDSKHQLNEVKESGRTLILLTPYTFRIML
jgi:hypothetical protein